MTQQKEPASASSKISDLSGEYHSEAAAYGKGFAAGVLSERERCRKIAKELEADEAAFHIREGHPA